MQMVDDEDLSDYDTPFDGNLIKFTNMQVLKVTGSRTSIVTLLKCLNRRAFLM